jgi:hypothetical protein
MVAAHSRAAAISSHISDDITLLYQKRQLVTVEALIFLLSLCRVKGICFEPWSILIWL